MSNLKTGFEKIANKSVSFGRKHASSKFGLKACLNNSFETNNTIRIFCVYKFLP